MKISIRHLVMAAALLLACAPLHYAGAADYPTRQITLIVPYTAAGGVDAMARVVAQKFSEAFKVQVVVENRPGGGGTIGTRAVTKAAGWLHIAVGCHEYLVHQSCTVSEFALRPG